MNSPTESELTEAVRLLQAGELVAFPTETVYGLGADAANPEAVAKIFAAKGRPSDHPLIVHVAGAGHLDQWARDIPQRAWDLAEAFWPGPLTLILKRAPNVPKAVTGGQGGLSGIAAPSANRFGRISPTDARHVREELGSAVAMVLDGGPCDVGIESKIIDLSRDGMPARLQRPGHITPEQIEEVIGEPPELPDTMKPMGVPRVSGSLDAHYAPRTPMRMEATRAIVQAVANEQRRGRRCGVLAHSEHTHLSAGSLCQLPGTPEAYARGLYAALRDLDQAGNDIILVEAIPATPAWDAVADRLRRAVCGSGQA